MLMDYFRKMKGTAKSPPRVRFSEILWSWIGGFLGIGLVAVLNERFFEGTDLTLIVGSLGASAVLLFGAVRSPLAQPPNVFGGQVLSALVGVTAYKLLHFEPGLAAAVAVATAIAAMHATKTLHPPGGATALIAVIGGEKVHGLGYLYAALPVGAGVAVLILVALLVNNIPDGRRYPEFWI